ncbi:hypothetical protein EP18_19420 [Lysinibacillus sphaericus]|nr:hypothetical protein [Lysinibacillus sphaericus]KEK10187.1 hypothetical protein EP18_19420 [Lysinibacillus sphaericus]
MSSQEISYQEKGFVSFFQGSAASFFISVVLIVVYGVMQKWMQPNIGNIVIDIILLLPYMVFLVYMATGLTAMFQKLTKCSNKVNLISILCAVISGTTITVLLATTIFQKDNFIEILVLSNVITLVYTLFGYVKGSNVTFYASLMPFVFTLLYFPAAMIFMGN